MQNSKSGSPCGTIALGEGYPKSDPSITITPLKDSGERREFTTGAIRDISEGKGRCDLMPLRVLAMLNPYAPDGFLMSIGAYLENAEPLHLQDAIQEFIHLAWKADSATACLELAKHYESGAQKYGIHNWKKGIPLHCYVDSAVRHYLKWKRDDTDEPHDRACLWNLTCALWTIENHPELVDIEFEKVKSEVCACTTENQG